MVIAYTVIMPQTLSLVSQQKGKSFTPYKSKVENFVELIQKGKVSSKEMFKEEQFINMLLSWGIRLGGFLMLFFGMKLVLTMLSNWSNVFPIFKNLHTVGMGFLSFCVATQLSWTYISWRYLPDLVGWSSIVGLITIVGLIFLKTKKHFGKSKFQEYKPTINPTKTDIEFGQVQSSIIEAQNAQKKQFKERGWYVYSKKKKYGPYSLNKINELLDKGKIKLTTKCRQSGSKNKMRINDIPEIKKTA